LEGRAPEIRGMAGKNERNRSLLTEGREPLGVEGGQVGVVETLEGADRSILRKIAHGAACGEGGLAAGARMRVFLL
jgi:hypothetical protein